MRRSMLQVLIYIILFYLTYTNFAELAVVRTPAFQRLLYLYRTVRCASLYDSYLLA